MAKHGKLSCLLMLIVGVRCACVFVQGIKLGVSSRGWASVVTDPHSKQVVVEPDYQLITFDFVPEPSNAGAYVVPISRRYRYGHVCRPFSHPMTGWCSNACMHALVCVQDCHDASCTSPREGPSGNRLPR